jgi:hypothetical protein
MSRRRRRRRCCCCCWPRVAGQRDAAAAGGTVPPPAHQTKTKNHIFIWQTKFSNGLVFFVYRYQHRVNPPPSPLAHSTQKTTESWFKVLQRQGRHAARNTPPPLLLPLLLLPLLLLRLQSRSGQRTFDRIENR